MPKNLRHVLVVSGGTLGSRVAGLGRDILIFGFLGAGLHNSAFLMAFTLPNLFRRLLGEGALTSAFIPVASDEADAGGKTRAFAFLNRVLTRLFLFLLGLTILGVGLAWSLRFWPGLPERWYMVADLSIFLLPYVILICLAAIAGAGLNLFERFATPAFSPILLNMAMIVALLGGALFFTRAPGALTLWLCAGVLAGGLLQLAFPIWDLRRQGWRPRWDTRTDPALDRLMGLLIPGLAGAAVIQVNLLVVRLLAYAVDESGVALLYLASRLIEFPLGVFSLAVITVAFPGMARMVSAGDADGFGRSFREGLRLLLAISLPAAVGLMILATPVIDTLFRYGAFRSEDVAAAAPLLILYAAGLPFYSMATFLVRGLHAQKDMKSPLKVAVAVLFLNLALSLLLIRPLGIAGLALANVLASVFQTLVLFRALRGHAQALHLRRLLPDLWRMVGGCLLLGIFCLAGLWFLGRLDISDRSASILGLALLIPGGASLYFVFLYLTGFRELSRLTALWKRPLPPAGTNR